MFRFVSFCLSRIELLQQHGVKPLLVFDGVGVSAKRNENAERRKQRELSLEKAMAAQAKGDSATARSFFARAVCVTHDMAHQLIVTLRERNIPFLVAPYEADAQMAFLSRNGGRDTGNGVRSLTRLPRFFYCKSNILASSIFSGLADVVITEDSDALVFGCKRVLYKMEKDGSGSEVQLRNLGANADLSFVNWSPDMVKFKFQAQTHGLFTLPFDNMSMTFVANA